MHRTCLRIGQKEIFHDSHWHLVSYWTTFSPRSPHPLLDILLVRLGVGSRIPVQYRPVLIYYSGRFWDMTRRHEGVIRLATVHAVCNWCPSNQYKPTLGHPECRDCTICGSNEYETAPCTLYSDRQCAPCSTCTADEIESFACSAYFNTGCYDYHLFCRRCGVGELLQGCTIDSPGECFCLPGYTRNAQGVCTACPDAWYKTTVGDDPCLPCSFCVDDDNKHCESMCTCTASTDFNPLTCPNDCQNAISLDTCPDNQAYDDSYTCVCTVGYELKDGACSPCPYGHVKYTVGNTACVEMEGCDMADYIECNMLTTNGFVCYTYT